MFELLSHVAPPACPGDFPDPFVLVTDRGYFALATNRGNVNVQVRASEDLRTWEDRPDALPQLPRWAQAGFTWSPAAIERDGTFVMWYVCREPQLGRQAISVAVSTEPGGPYVDSSVAPAIYQVTDGGSIDPSFFVDTDGQPYLLWKCDANALNKPSTLWIQPLSADGRSLEDEATLLLTHDLDWENPLIEAPSMALLDGEYWLFYSAGWYDSDSYCMGLASAPKPTGPFSKRRRAWVTSDRHGAGPGGQEFFRDRDGKLRLAYHAWDPHNVSYKNGGERSLRISAVEAKPGGPRLGAPISGP